MTESITEPPPAVRCAPILRWAGSKRQLRERVAEYWKSRFQRYVEPFAGSCSLFFWIAPHRAVLGDLNEGLIEVYRVLRENPAELHALASSIPRGSRSYYEQRSKHTEALSPMERAARFIFLNRYCFNGIYRTDLAGRFNVPFSPAKTGGIPSLAAFRACSSALQHADLLAADFGTTLTHAREGDFVYLDPPYAGSGRRIFTEYGPTPFTSGDLDRLGRHLRRLDSRGVGFVLSYADCPEVRRLGKPWHVRGVVVRRNVAGFRADRRRSREVIISNIEPE